MNQILRCTRRDQPASTGELQHTKYQVLTKLETVYPGESLREARDNPLYDKDNQVSNTYTFLVLERGEEVR